MLLRLLNLCSSIILIGITSCILPYELDKVEYDRVIVVNAVLTTENKQHSVKLSYTYDIELQDREPISGSQVWIEDDLGLVYDFTEINPGEYISNMSFAASSNREYQLLFITANGNQYYSNKIRPILSPPISEITNKYAEIIPKNSTSKVKGIQFFVNTSDPTGNARNFRYEWEDTYKIITPFISNLDYDTITDNIVTREVPISICYVTDSSSSLTLGSTTGSSQNRIADLPIRFVSGESDALRNRYSILVRQYAIDNATYTYYSKLNESAQNGSLFDEQQGTIIGNITSLSNPNETVLGNFEVSGVSSLRVFFNFSDLDSDLRFPSYRFICLGSDITGTSLDSVGYIFERPNNTLNIIRANDFSDPQVTLGSRNCTDCTFFASNEKPDFWID